MILTRQRGKKETYRCINIVSEGHAILKLTYSCFADRLYNVNINRLLHYSILIWWQGTQPPSQAHLRNRRSEHGRESDVGGLNMGIWGAV
jgi:hypothetical protein